MARPPKLNWDDSRGKWRVVYRGKKYRFPEGERVQKSDREAKKRAEVEWRAVKTQLDLEAEEAKPHRVEYRNVIAEWESVLRWCVEHGDEITAQVARDKIKDLESRLTLRVPPPLGWSDRFLAGPAPLPEITEINERMEPIYRAAGLEPVTLVAKRTGVQAKAEPWNEITEVGTPVGSAEEVIWHDRLESQDRRLENTGTDDTLAANVEQFLKEKRIEAAAGEISTVRADTLRTHLGIAMDYMGRQSSVRQIQATTLSAFRQHLLGRIVAKDIADTYARDVLASFKYFVRWLANNTDKLENLPKNIDDRQMRISVTQKKAKTLAIDQIETLLEEANSRTKLYLLLGLNCGMTQIDMSDLHPNEVDWERGIITRKRSKTQDCENVPVVSYPLWPETFALLKQERSDDPERVLLTRDGRPLRTDVLDGEKFKKTDAVRLAINRLAKKSEIKFTLKALKKTSASLLRGNRDYKGLESLFLDHAPRTVAEIHYTTAPQELLNEAIEWLGRELGIVED